MNVIKSIAEKKFYDTNLLLDQWAVLGSGMYLSNQSDPKSLCDIPQGLIDSNRVGDKINMLSLEFRHGWFPSDEIKIPQVYFFRVTIFAWFDDTTPSNRDIYEQSYGHIGELARVPGCWAYNHDRKVKRKILYDKSFSIAQQQVSFGASTQYYSISDNVHGQEKVIIPLSKVLAKNNRNVVNYQNGTTAGVNKIYVLMTNNIDDLNIPAIFVPFSHYVQARINFIDM